MRTVPQLDIEQVLEVVNHYSRSARAAAESESRGFAELGAVIGPVAEDVPDGSAVHELAEQAYGIFVAAEHGDDVAPAVNELLAPAGATPSMGRDGTIAWQVPDGAGVLRAALALPLLNWVHVRGPERLGLCRGIRCADAYVDSSPAGRRKYCSSGCLNRHKVAEHRRRRANAAADAAGADAAAGTEAASRAPGARTSRAGVRP